MPVIQTEENSGTSIVDEHFEVRQARRLEHDMRLVQRERERRSQETADRIREQNRARPAEDQFTTVCINCDRGVNHLNAEAWQEVNDEVVCSDCVRIHYGRCNDCNERHHYDHLYYAQGDHVVCDSCRDQNYRHCDNCGELVNNEDINYTDDTALCNRCYENEDNDEGVANRLYRPYYRGTKSEFCSQDKGSIVTHQRVFSAELETFCSDTNEFREVMTKSPKELGASTDGSISPDRYGLGIEFQTPKLQGKNGEKFIKELCERLSSNGFGTNKTCGLHIHLDGGNEFITNGDSREHKGTNTKLLFLFYLVFEDVILSFLPRSRRVNTYCKPLKQNFHVAEIMNCQNLDELEKLWYRTTTRSYVSNCKRENKHGSRYAGINFHTLLSGNHLEIRYHSGTVNALKILEWINLHGLIMENIANGAIQLAKIVEAQNILDQKEKTEYFLNLAGIKSKSSQAYFLKRQTRFMEKKEHEEVAFEEKSTS